VNILVTTRTKTDIMRRVKFLTAVWGASYVDRFCALSLPSFLASGNLPHLAVNSEFEVVICTCQSDITYFEKNSAFQVLKQLCDTRFVYIDDLMGSHVYGVTLTTAYGRAIIEMGEDMLSTHFLFMNSDFVLANGSLRGLFQHIDAGRSIVLGPSFRSVSEELEPILEDLVNKDSNVLDIAPRELTKLAMRYPHQTKVAKFQNQQLFHSQTPNQFFWKVNSQTLLGRYYLIFMLALKPERIVSSLNSYCDYGFIPELCPSGDEVCMSDSDDFFMLELQDRTSETSLLKLGRQSMGEIAKSLSRWTTKEHRRAAQYDIIFHSGELPSALINARQKAALFISRLNAGMGRAMSHRFHRHWQFGLEAWVDQRRANGVTTTPKEIEPLPTTWLLYAYRLRAKLRGLLKDMLGPHLRGRYKKLGRKPFYQIVQKGLGGGNKTESLIIIGCEGEVVNALSELPAAGSSHSILLPEEQTEKKYCELLSGIELSKRRVLIVLDRLDGSLFSAFLKLAESNFPQKMYLLIEAKSPGVIMDYAAIPAVVAGRVELVSCYSVGGMGAWSALKLTSYLRCVSVAGSRINALRCAFLGLSGIFLHLAMMFLRISTRVHTGIIPAFRYVFMELNIEKTKAFGGE